MLEGSLELPVLSPFVESFLFSDVTGCINKVSEESLTMQTTLLNFCKKLHSIEEAYITSLEKLYQSTLQTKLNWNLSKRGTSFSGFGCILEENHKVFEYHKDFSSKLSNLFIPQLDEVIKNYKQNKKSIAQESQTLTKELNDSYSYHNKAKTSYIEANIELENLSNQLDALKSKTSSKPEEILKGQAKILQQKDKVEKCDEEYKKSIENANSKQKIYYHQRMPNIISRFEQLEETQAESLKALLINHYCMNRLEIPPLLKATFELTYRRIEDLDTEIEILHKASVYSSSTSITSSISAGSASTLTQDVNEDKSLNFPNPFVYEPFSSDTKRPANIRRTIKSMFTWSNDSTSPSSSSSPSSSISTSSSPSSSSTSSQTTSTNTLPSNPLSGFAITQSSFNFSSDKNSRRTTIVESSRFFKKSIQEILEEESKPKKVQESSSSSSSSSIIDDENNQPLDVLKSPSNSNDNDNDNDNDDGDNNGSSTKRNKVDGIPSIFISMLKAILKNKGEEAEGLFRVPASTEEVRQLKAQYEKGVYSIDNIPKDISPFTLGSLLKLWLRELSIPLIPDDVYQEFVENSKDLNKVESLLNEKIPPNHKKVLLTLIAFLQYLSSPSVVEKTRMGKENYAMVFAPCILRCPFDNQSLVMYAALESNLTLTLLQLNVSSEFSNLFIQN